MTIDDLIYLIGKLTVDREALLKRIADLEARLAEAETAREVPHG